MQLGVRYKLTLVAHAYYNYSMKAPFRKQLTQASRMLGYEPDTESVGILTPVHVQDVIKDRNLDYLEKLGELVQKMNANPVWYEYQTNENKAKFLQIYQLSINYAKNTESIYGGILNELDQQYEQKKQKVSKLKNDILTHKEKTLKLRKYYRKQRLNKQKQKVLNYQRNIKVLRDDLLKQKHELQAKNQQYLLQQRKRQEKKMQAASSHNPNPFNYLQANNQAFGIPQGYPPQAYPPQAFSPQAYPPFYVYQGPQVQFAQGPFKHFAAENDGGANKNQIKTFPNSAINIQPSATQIEQNPKTRKQIRQTLSKQEKLEMTDSIIEQKPKQKKEQYIKISEGKSDGVRETNKSYSFQKSGNVRQSNLESQTGDEVKDLYPNSVARRGLQSKMSNKSINDMSEADIDSYMNIQLTTQSKNDVDQKHKRNPVRQVSIAQQLPIQGKSAIQNKLSVPKQTEPKVQKKQVQVRDYKKNQMNIKISGVKEVLSPEPPAKKEPYNYLQQSNQGVAFKGADGLAIGLNMNKIKLKESDRLGASVANSMEDVKSKYQSNVNDQEAYQDDFEEDVQPEKTRVKVNVDYSDSSPTKRNCQYAQLLKNYFILKQDAKNMKDSNFSSGIGSLKELSVRFVGSQRRKTFNDNKSKGASVVSQSDNIEMIDMPEDSVIAKPSKLKQSTIRKSTIQQKIHKSHDAKTQQFTQMTPIKRLPKFGEKQKNEKSAKDMEDNFRPINQQLKSKVLPKNNELLKVPKVEEGLGTSLTESHVITQNKITQQKQQDEDDQESILSVIPESQNESLFHFNSNKNKILQLIDKKYSQKGKVQIDKNLIKNQINTVLKQNGQQLSWEELIDTFKELSSKKEIQINKLKEQRMKKIKQLKDQLSNKIPSKPNSTKSISKAKIETKSIQKIKQQDDLTYSRSMFQNIPSMPSDKQKEKQKQAVENNSIKQNKEKSQQVKKLPTNEQMAEQKQSKFILDQRGKSIDNNRMLNKFIETSKFDKDDEIQNAIKTNFQQTLKNKKKDDSDDGF